MRNTLSEADRRNLRTKLVAMIEASNAELDGRLADETSLIKSGKLDSLGLFNLAIFVEREVGHKVDIASFDLATEWDTITDIVNFIGKLRIGQA